MSTEETTRVDFGTRFIENERAFVAAYLEETGRPDMDVLVESVALHVQAIALSIAMGIVSIEGVMALLAHHYAELVVSLATANPAATEGDLEDEAIARELDQLRAEQEDKA